MKKNVGMQFAASNEMEGRLGPIAIVVFEQLEELREVTMQTSRGKTVSGEMASERALRIPGVLGEIAGGSVSGTNEQGVGEELFGNPYGHF